MKNGTILTKGRINCYVDKFIILKYSDLATLNDNTKYNLYAILSLDKVIIKDFTLIEKIGIAVKIEFMNNEYEYVIDYRDKPYLLKQENISLDKNRLIINAKIKDKTYTCVHTAINILITIALIKKKSIDFELLYIGQAYGKNNNRTAKTRLLNHSTMQKILSDCLELYNKEIYVFLMTINDPLMFISLNGAEISETANENDELKKFIELSTYTNDEYTFKQTLNLAEALLIHHFKPKYNSLLKEGFPNKNSIGYKDYLDMNCNSATFEFSPKYQDFSYINFKTKENCFSTGYIEYKIKEE